MINLKGWEDFGHLKNSKVNLDFSDDRNMAIII